MKIARLLDNRVLIRELDNEAVTGEVSLSSIVDLVLPDSIAQDKGKHMQATIVELGEGVQEESLAVGQRVTYERWRTKDLGDGLRICYEEAISLILPQQGEQAT